MFTTKNINKYISLYKRNFSTSYLDNASKINIQNNRTTFDDIVDFQNTVEIKYLPGTITQHDIKSHFKECSITANGIKMVFDDDFGFAYVSFNNKDDFRKAIDNKVFSFGGKNYEMEALKASQTNWTAKPTSYLNRTAVTTHLWNFRNNLGEIKPESTPQPPLETKTPKDSYTEIDLLFSSDLALREMYLSPYGNIRVGKFLEDLDALAGTVSFKHAESVKRNLTLVTASIDKIKLLKPLLPDRDIRMQGITTYVGKSSMEILIRVSSKNPETGGWENVLEAFFTMVARDAFKHKAAAVNHLIPQTEKEKKLFQEGEKHKEQRFCASKQSLDITPPTPSELQIIHTNFMVINEKLKREHSIGSKISSTSGLDTYKVEEGNKVIEFVLMKDTKLVSAILCQPQERNINGNIFGGFLMRKGFEIAFTTCFTIFNKSLPKFYAMDDITFLLPVNIGDILTLESTIVYTQHIPETPNCYYVQVEVLAYISKPIEKQSTKQLSNVFNFTFFCNQNDFPVDATTATTSIPVVEKRILPETYSEAMRYLTGKRMVDRHQESADSTESWI